MNQNNKHSGSGRRMIDSGVEWIGKMPQGWQVSPLKSMAKIVNGGTPKSDPIFWDGGINWATPADFSNGATLTSTKRTITEVGLAGSGEILSPGSILVSCRAPVGKVCLVRSPTSFNQGCRGVVPSLHITPEYTFYSLQAGSIEMELMSSGTTFFEIPSSVFSGLKFPLPPLPEQRAIASYLDHHVSLIDQERNLIAQKIDLLKEKRRAMIYEVVTGKRVLVEREALAGRDDWSDVIGSGPVVAIPAPRADDPFVRKGRLVDSGVEWIGDIPEGWDVKKVKELTNNIQSGRTPVDMESVINADGIPWITISDMSSGKISAQESVRVDPGSAGPEAKIGDVLYSIYATIGVAAGPVDMPLATNQAILSLRPVGNGVYLKYCLDAIRPFVLEAALSNTQANLSAGSVRNLLLPAPTLAEQQTIVSFLNHNTYLIDQEIDLLAQKRDLLGEQRKALIFEAVTGKLDVSA